MVTYALEQRWEILRLYFKNHGNVAECVRKLRMDFGRREEPSAAYVRCLMNKMKETGILIDKMKSKKQYVYPRILQTNFILSPWYDAIQCLIGSEVEANLPSSKFSLR